MKSYMTIAGAIMLGAHVNGYVRET